MDKKALVSDNNKVENKGSNGKDCDGSRVVDKDFRIRRHSYTFGLHFAVSAFALATVKTS